MVKSYHHPYRRLTDPEISLTRPAAALRRTTTTVLVVVIVAVVATLIIIGSLVAFLSILAGEPRVSSDSATTPVDLGPLLERLSSLEREVAELKAACRRCSMPTREHQNQQPSDEASYTTDSPALLELIQVQAKTPSRALPSVTVSTFPPLDGESADIVSVEQQVSKSPHQQHRRPRSRDRVGPSRRHSGDSPDDQAGLSTKAAAPLEDGGSQGRSSGNAKRRRDRKRNRSPDEGRHAPEPSGPPEDSGCRHCTGNMFGIAAHIEGNRFGNIPILDRDGWISGLTVWRMSSHTLETEQFKLSILGGVTVKESGLYYVYSQVLFYDPNSTVGQSICINDRPRFTCTKSNISDEAKQSTCFIGGVVRMSAEDQVRIKLSIPGLTVALYPDTTFFGLFRVA
ncbi:uncharacterized protein LOC110989945 [Acanthaster planci]|uniref:Uncharacterized protein LOC110989945 n=1 Tax=Acanthaster planci TaxID=133434 RepID=A0A8B7ZZ33_ACAPL|nr:uncharacterized protein LOC110989945 [Acanthaster planci]